MKVNGLNGAKVNGAYPNSCASLRCRMHMRQ